MGVRVSTLKEHGKGTNRSNAYRGRIIGGESGAKTWADVWVCQHYHDNRDNDSNHAASARTCAEWELHKIQTAVGTLNPEVADIRAYGTEPRGLFLLEDASAAQISWLAKRSEDIRAGRAGNAGNRRAYPEFWVEVGGQKYRGKLWEGTDRAGEHHRRLFVAGPFGSDDYLDGHVDLDTHEVELRNKQTRGTMIPLAWQRAAKELEWTIPQWAPRSESAKDEFHGEALRRAQSDEEALEVPAVYRVRIMRQGATRSYDVVEVQTDEVMDEGLSRVQAYRRVEELNEEYRRINRKIKSPDRVWVDQYIREGEVWSNKFSCSHCHVDLHEDQSAFLVDQKQGGGPVYCSREHARISLEELDRKVIKDNYIKREEQE